MGTGLQEDIAMTVSLTANEVYLLKLILQETDRNQQDRSIDFDLSLSVPDRLRVHDLIKRLRYTTSGAV